MSFTNATVIIPMNRHCSLRQMRVEDITDGIAQSASLSTRYMPLMCISHGCSERAT